MELEPFSEVDGRRSTTMAGDKTKIVARNRNRVAGSEVCEVEHLARQYGISFEQTRNQIDKFGNT
jgi:hypothetical protein